MMSEPDTSTLKLAGVQLYYTPLIKKAIEYARSYNDEMTYNHVVRSWIFATILQPMFQHAPLAPAGVATTFDHEAMSIAILLHDLGWEHSGRLTSLDKRFEVDGANAACQFLLRETADSKDWDRHRIQLVWDAIALHATASIAKHKEPEVAATQAGILADFVGADGFPGGLLTWEKISPVVKEFPRDGFVSGVADIMCHFCKTKPDTTYDNFVGEYGDKYVDGYSRQGKLIIDHLEKDGWEQKLA
ncbi:hypothetical protein F5884DRAFT_769062 [Xylogone sp. PMI_703]|nr:hypothetical protein F5884DRAFT_769062 [Xylogone sp. PMI_703]